MNFENNNKNKKNIIKISASVVVLASLLFYGVSKYSENEEEKALITVNQKNYKVIKSLFSSDSSRDNLKAFDKEMDNFNTNDNLCKKVQTKEKKQDCYNKEVLMKEFITQKLFVKNLLAENLQNENYFNITAEIFNFKERSDVSKFLNDENNKELTNIYSQNKNKIGKRATITTYIKSQSYRWLMPNYSNTLNIQDGSINQTLDSLVFAVNNDCAGSFETQKCLITTDELESLKIKKTQFGQASLQKNDPYITKFENTINKGFDQKIIKINLN